MTEELKMQHYDALVNITIQNIYSLSKAYNKIIIGDFDWKDKEHLFILEAALMARDIFGFPIYIDGIKNFCIVNWKIRKTHKPIKLLRKHEKDGMFSTIGILQFQRKDGINNIHPDFTFAEIYEAYYEEKGDKK